MRNLKFRAWDKDMNEMVFVSGIQFDANSPKEKPNIIDQHNDIRDLEDIILMQYINCKDKNGTDIYEGDIIKWDDCSDGKYWRVAVVEQNPDIQFKIVKNTLHELSCDEGDIFHFGNFIYTNTDQHLIVCGNIYQNSDFLILNTNAKLEQ